MGEFSVSSTPIFSKEDYEREGGAFKVELLIENPEKITEWLRMKEDFLRRAETVFLRYAFQVNKYLIRLTPADTGKLRAGWTALLDKYNQTYDRQFFDTTLYDPYKENNRTPYSQEYHWDASEIAEGRSLSTFEETPFNITLINNVEHGEFLEFGTSKHQGIHFTELARYKAELWFGVIFNQWFEKISSEGKVTDLDTPDEELEIPI